jgi:hypothetical protein
MVNVDWVAIATERGDPVEKEGPEPLASTPDGPVTVQDTTPLALHEICELAFAGTRTGFAEMVASGE